MKRLLIILAILLCASVASAADVTLAWDASTDTRVTSYKLYYGTTSGVYGTPVDVGKVTQFKLTGIAEGVNVFFAVTAVASVEKLESGYSTELPAWTVVPSISGSGTITPSVAKVLSAINSQTFTIAASTGNIIKDVTVDGVSVGAVTTYTFTNLNKSHTIKATFALAPVPIKAITGVKIIN